MDTQTIISGGSIIVLLVATLLTLPVSAILLRIFRNAVISGMVKSAGSEVKNEPKSARIEPDTALQISFPFSRNEKQQQKQLDRLHPTVVKAFKRVGLIYGFAGLLFAIIFALAWNLIADNSIHPIRTLLLVMIFSWPIILTWIYLFTLGKAEKAKLIGGYFIVFVAIGASLLALDTGLDFRDLAILWILFNGPTSIMIVAFHARKVRAAGPLVLAFMVVAVTGGILLFLLVGGDVMTLMVLMLAGLILFGLLGWSMLKLIGKHHRLKKMSEQSLNLDAIWLIFGITNSLILAANDWRLVFTSILAFMIYRMVLFIGLKMNHESSRSESFNLLLLRVFSLGARSIRLFDALGKQWLRIGTISLIAGPDLATGIVGPQEFLDFLGGNLSRKFVQNQEDLENHLQTLDIKADPDGRFRVNSFYCRDDTWKMTMMRLSSQCSATLIDLRSFSPSNQGCLFELGQLLDIVPLEHILVLVDQSTDHAYLVQTLKELWRSIASTSPNLNLSEPKISFFEITSGTGLEAIQLFHALYGISRQS